MKSANVPEDLSINDIESVAELVLEDFMDINNLFAEHDEQDEDDGYSLELKVSFFFDGDNCLSSGFHPGAEKKSVYCYISPFCPENYSEVLNPPPEV